MNAIECEVCRKSITETDDLMEVGGKLTCGSIECIKKEIKNIEKSKSKFKMYATTENENGETVVIRNLPNNRKESEKITEDFL